MSLACYYCQSIAIKTTKINGKDVCLFCEHLAREEEQTEAEPELEREDIDKDTSYFVGSG